jgi:glycosyltransferase involved in cell wall biosynthesis
MDKNNNNNHSPLISVITVCFNSEKYLEETIKSVINQSYSNIEYIIVDGGSTDGTLNVIRKYEKYISKWISEPDDGIYDAMNKGIKMSNGELIGILNSDDWYEKDAINRVIDFYFQKKEPGIIHGKLNIYQNENFVKTKSPDLSAEAKINFAWHPTCFVPKKIYNKNGLFKKNYKVAADSEFLLRLKKNNVNFYFLNFPITNFRLGGASDNTWKHSLESFKVHKEYYSFFLAFKLFYRKTFLKEINKTIKRLLGEKVRKKISNAYKSIKK